MLLCSLLLQLSTLILTIGAANLRPPPVTYPSSNTSIYAITFSGSTLSTLSTTPSTLLIPPTVLTLLSSTPLTPLYHPSVLPPPSTSTTSSTPTIVTTTLGFVPIPLPPAATPNQNEACCFVVQDVVTEEWWDVFTTSSIFKVVTKTQITARFTPYANRTVTNLEINTVAINTSVPVTARMGVNPISLLGNAAAHPAEYTQVNNGTATVTGGVTVQSPAAFYVYSTVKVITAAAITDSAGNLACGTSIGGFPNLNPNAQAYFGGSGAKPIFARSDDSGLNPRAPAPAAPAIITLATPFIYQPARGKLGTTISEACGGSIAPGTEDYGYVPQTVFDYLISNKGISAQYPGLSACLPAGPSIKAINCGTVEFVTTTIIGPPTIITQVETSTRTVFFNWTITLPGTTGFSTSIFNVTSTFTITIPGSTFTRARSGSNSFSSPYYARNAFPRSTPAPLTSRNNSTNSTTPSMSGNDETRTVTAVTPSTSVVPVPARPSPTTIVDSSLQTYTTTHLITAATGTTVIESPVTHDAPPPGTPTAPTYVEAVGPSLVDPIVSIYVPPESAVGPGPAPVVTPNPVDSLGESIGNIVCQIIGCAPGPLAKPNVQGSGPSVVVSPTTFRLPDAPLGITGQISTIGGTAMLIVTSQETFVPFNPTAPPIPGASVTIINGSPSIVISSPTLVPAVNAPPQLSNAPITIINNIPYLVVGPTTFAAPSAQTNGAITTNIGGTNFIVFPSATNIPLSDAPPGLAGSLTIINNTPFLAVPGSTNIPIPATQTGTLATTVINGTPFVVVGSPTQIPLSNAPPGLTGVTTTINGTPFLIIPSATTFPLPTSPSNVAQVTVINGVTEIIITGLATLPVNSAYSVSGLTTVISGITEVIVSTPTTISLRTSTSSTSTSSASSSTISSTSSTRSSTSSRTSSTTSTSASHTPTILSSNSSLGKDLSTGAKIGIAFGVLIFALLVLGLILFLRRRRQDRERYDPVAASEDDGAAPPVVEQLRTSTQIGADSYTPVVRTRGGYTPAPQQEWMSTMRRQSIPRRPVPVEVAE